MSHSPTYVTDQLARTGEKRALLLGDCREWLGRLPDGCVALTHTSPPYNIDRPYQGFSDRQNRDEYCRLVKDVFAHLARVTRPGGSVFWQTGYTGNEKNTGGIHLLDALTLPIAESAGFIVWDRIIWHYFGSMAFRAKFTNRHETIIWFVNGQNAETVSPSFELDAVRERAKSYDGRNHLLGRNPGNVWYAERVAYGSTGQTSHVAVFPEEVSEKIIRACSSPGDLVLDPFCGSGTAPKVALTLGRQFVGCDISEQYLAEADRRLKAWGNSQVQNLAIGLMVSYGWHGQPGSKGLRQLADLLQMFCMSPGTDRKVKAFQRRVDEVLRAERVSKAVKLQKQEIWMELDALMRDGHESDEVVAADRALGFCYAHRRQWNGVRRFLSAADALRELSDRVSDRHGAEGLVREVCRVAEGRFALDGRSVACSSADAALGCNGTATPKRRAESGETEPALWGSH